MADPRDARIAELEELLNAAETARQAAEEERDAFRQVLAFWDVLVADWHVEHGDARHHVHVESEEMPLFFGRVEGELAVHDRSLKHRGRNGFEGQDVHVHSAVDDATHVQAIVLGANP